MQDLSLQYRNGTFDLELADGDIASNNLLYNGVLVSMFSHARIDNAGGYWADNISDYPNDITGSTVWSLLPKANTQATRLAIADSIRASLRWLIDDSVCDDITVEIVEFIRNRITFKIELHRLQAEDISTYEVYWNAHANTLEIINEADIITN